MLQPATDRASAALLMSSGLHLDQAHRSLGRDYPFKLKIRRSFFLRTAVPATFRTGPGPSPTASVLPTVMCMTKLRETWPIGLGFCGALLVPQIAGAQMPLPAAKPTDGATLFKQQCGTCHTTNPSEPVQQGPSLFKI